MENNNILRAEWIARYSGLPTQVKIKLDAISNNMDETQLIKIKKSYKYPETGDVFVFEPREKIFFYGIVLNAHVKYMSFDDLYVVALFKIITNTIGMENFAVDYNRLFVPPLRVGRYYWTTGLFYNVGSIERTQFSPIPSYGFYDADSKFPYTDEYGNVLNERPEYLSIGVATSIGVGYKINKELIIDNSILE